LAGLANVNGLERPSGSTATTGVYNGDSEPDDWVAGNDEFKVAADRLLQLVQVQLKSLGDKPGRE